jgi:hypothetical protein
MRSGPRLAPPRFSPPPPFSASLFPPLLRPQSPLFSNPIALFSAPPHAPRTASPRPRRHWHIPCINSNPSQVNNRSLQPPAASQHSPRKQCVLGRTVDRLPWEQPVDPPLRAPHPAPLPPRQAFHPTHPFTLVPPPPAAGRTPVPPRLFENTRPAGAPRPAAPSKTRFLLRQPWRTLYPLSTALNSPSRTPAVTRAPWKYVASSPPFQKSPRLPPPPREARLHYSFPPPPNRVDHQPCPLGFFRFCPRDFPEDSLRLRCSEPFRSRRTKTPSPPAQ